MAAHRAIRGIGAFALLMGAATLLQASTITTSDGNVTVTSVVTEDGPLFEYNYTVTDGTGLLAVLDIDVTPGISISGETAPGGSSAYMTAYDPGLGLVSFLSNNASFPSTPESGFIFFSPVGPGSTSFGITLFDDTTGSVGGIQGPIAPEPASLALCGLGIAGILFWRKRFQASAPSKSTLSI